MEAYDFKKKEIVEGADLDVAGRSLAAAVLGDLIYVCGGTNNKSELNLFKSFSPKLNTWTSLAPLSKKLYCHGTVALNCEIYVIGGYDGFCLSDCEKFDPKSNSWSPIKAMLSPRLTVGVAVLNGKIYACGGELYDKKSLNSVEVYEPSTNEWSFVAPMNEKRSRHVVIAFNGKLYAIGGYDCSGNSLSSAEMYDPSKNTWSSIAPLLTPVHAMSCGFVPY